MIVQAVAEVVENLAMAERTYRIRLMCPQIAAAIRPGQFVMLRIRNTTDPLLGRPFALYDTVPDSSGNPIGLDVVYLVVGKLTGLLSEIRAGDTIEIWGPLGNGFPNLGGSERVNLVAGGIGQTPFLAYARQLLGLRGYAGDSAARQAPQVTLFYGVRSKSFAAGIVDFLEAGCEVQMASDDGSVGQRGFITQLLDSVRPTGPFVGCGPEPMLQALARLTESWGAKCYLSLETPMACGFGACFSCVTQMRTATGVDYKRVCVEGPVFDAATLVLWE